MAKSEIDINSSEISETINKLADAIRTERSEYDSYIDTYAEPSLITTVNNKNNQIIYGRRGTGKTHLLFALREKIIEKKNSLPVYIDLRSILPIISEHDTSKIETSILIFKLIFEEILKSIAENLNFIFGTNQYEETHSATINSLQEIYASLNYDFNGTHIRKLGEISFSNEDIYRLLGSLNISVNPELKLQIENQNKRISTETRIIYISFSEIYEKITSITKILSGITIYCLFDEWSELPISLQPYVSELLKKMFITSSYVLKIAAIPYRSKFRINDESNTLGLEEGGDIFPVLLDNRFIFEIEKDQTRNFYNNLLFLHMKKINPDILDGIEENLKEEAKRTFINSFFANVSLNEILVASAGIPRDFIHLFINSYNNRTNLTQRIVASNVRNATVQWYSTDKKEEIEKDVTTKKLFEMIVKEIVLNKKKTHFLLPQSLAGLDQIKRLIDLRVLHLRKQGISHKHKKNVSYNIYSIDYGSYTSLDIPKRELDAKFPDLQDQITLVEDYDDARSISLEEDFFEKYLLEIGSGITCQRCGKTIDTTHPAYQKQKICNHCWEKVET